MTQTFEKMSRQQAIDRYRPFVPSLDSQPKSQLESELRENGIAEVVLDTPVDAYQLISDQYDICMNEHPEWLNWTAGSFDKVGVPEDGHVRKELSINLAGMQISDPKVIFHFNDTLRKKWYRMQQKTPPEFKDYMEHGFYLQSDLARSAANIMDILDESYRGIKHLYFPSELGSITFRLLRYDGYDTHDGEGKLIVDNGAQIAKPHYDRGGATIQAYASAPGFWRQLEGRHGAAHPKLYPPHGVGMSQFFFGAANRVVYGSKNNPIKPLYHGVDRIISVGAQNIPDYVPPRTAAIGFIDMPGVDLKITSRDTQPERIDMHNLDI